MEFCTLRCTEMGTNKKTTNWRKLTQRDRSNAAMPLDFLIKQEVLFFVTSSCS